ncbi:MAG: hypothetical protein K8S24_01355 [Candidatus Aegiribacteria sp.]|nr:hypothetical protein [Candidatus Aegiribacteria sp.]
MIALSLAVSILFGVSADFSDEITVHHEDISGSDGVVNTYSSMVSPMGLDYDSVNGWLWQASENGGLVYTVNPSDGTYYQRFDINAYFGSYDLKSNGVYLDEVENNLYLTDYNGDVGVTFYDAVYCFDVNVPDSPILVDTWDFGSTDGILGITYKAPYFYCSFYGAGQLRAYTLNPGGTYTLENVWTAYYGGIWYDIAWDVFYTHDALGTVVRVLDGSDPSVVLDSFTPGCTLTCAMSDDPDPSLLWTSDFYTDTNIRFDDEYIPVPLVRSTWGSIKTVF